MAEFKVLVPLDGSHLAEHPLVYLKALKHMGEVKVRLLSVVDIGERRAAADPNETCSREANLLSSYLHEVAADVRAHAGIEVETQVARGVPAYALINLSSQIAPDLLIVATHGRSGISRWRMGGVADKLIRGATCNTLVIGPRATDQEQWIDLEVVPPFKSILVPLDGSERAKQGVAVAADYARHFGSRVHLVSAAHMPGVAAGFAMEGAYFPPLLEEIERGMVEDLDKIAATLRPEIDVATSVRTGDAATELDAYARLNGIDLVVMSSHGRGGAMRTALGSVADRMLSTSDAPVLLVRAPTVCKS